MKRTRIVAIAALGAVLALGALHTPLGRPWLARLAGCPLGRADAHACQREAEGAVAMDRGPDLAPARPALGFDLDRTTMTDVVAWAAKSSVACERVREGTLFKCTNVPGTALGGTDVDDLTLAFRDDGTLWAVSAWNVGVESAAATDRVRAVTGALGATFGKSSSSYGAIDAIGGAPGSGFGAKFAYRDYVANVVATTSSRGVSIQQQYSSLRGRSVEGS